MTHTVADAVPLLFTPLTIRQVTTRNRLWVSPMCQYMAEDGVPNDWHLVHLGAFARGGAGLVMTEAAAVQPSGRITPQDAGIYTDEQRDAWRPVVDFIHSQGAVAAIQLAHAGRKASTFRPWAGERGSVPADAGGWETVAPSPIAFSRLTAPRELSQQDIADLVADFAAAARRSVEAGFDVVEIHGAHGYLVHQFLSAQSNQRDDQYGGTLENRARFLLETIRAVRTAVGEQVPVFVRLSATDWAPADQADAWDEQQTATVAGWAAEAGADLFDISTGGTLSGVQIPVGPGYQVTYAEFVRGNADVRTSAVGMITEAQQAAGILHDQKADAVMVGREFLRDPHLPLRFARELGVEMDFLPHPYERAF